MELVALPNKEAKTVSDAIFQARVCHFGILDQISMDGGKNSAIL